MIGIGSDGVLLMAPRVMDSFPTEPPKILPPKKGFAFEVLMNSKLQHEPLVGGFLIFSQIHRACKSLCNMYVNK